MKFTSGPYKADDKGEKPAGQAMETFIECIKCPRGMKHKELGGLTRGYLISVSICGVFRKPWMNPLLFGRGALCS
jgi:hypothetical protein